MIRAIIVDDESYARQRLKKLLSRYGDIKVVAEAQNGVEALEKVDEINPDIIFLDIEMPELSGIEVARSLGFGGPRIVFVTAYDEYALEAFESNSLDYLVKPLSSERLDLCIRKIQNSVELESNSKRDTRYLENIGPSHKLAFKIGKQFKVIDVREISSIAAQDHYALIRLSEKEYFVDDTLTELEAKLPPGKFLRVHRSAIINLDCVSELSHKGDRKYTAILNDFSHSEIPISRSALPKLKRILSL